MARPVKKIETEATIASFGPIVRQWLADIGVRSLADLKTMGHIVAYRRVKERQPGASINLLWSFFGAVKNRDWLLLTTPEKDKLREELESLNA